MMRFRRGSTLLELAVAVVMLGVLLAISVQTLSWTVRERRATDRRTAALVEAGNTLDELTKLPWDEITEVRLNAMHLSADTAAILPEGELEMALRQPAGDPTAKQITVAIDWIGDHRQREAPVRLMAWMFK